MSGASSIIDKMLEGMSTIALVNKAPEGRAFKVQGMMHSQQHATRLCCHIKICGARCTHCDALNMFPGFAVIEAFIRSECGEGVVVNRSVQ